MRQLPKIPNLAIIGFVAASLAVHLLSFGGVHVVQRFAPEPPQKAEPVKFKVVEKKPVAEPTPKPTPPPPKPTPVPPKPKKLAETRKPEKKPQKNAKKVQGLTTKSTVKDSTVAAPVGNTMMAEDSGVRLSAEELASLERDLSADAQLIRDTLTVPEYTEAAIDAEIEGVVVVDVFVDQQGKVIQAELRKRIGYGMDERVVMAIMAARFVPRKNGKGMPLSGWAELPFKLELN
jgi:TonB family protein